MIGFCIAPGKPNVDEITLFFMYFTSRIKQSSQSMISHVHKKLLLDGKMFVKKKPIIHFNLVKYGVFRHHVMQVMETLHYFVLHHGTKRVL